MSDSPYRTLVMRYADLVSEQPINTAPAAARSARAASKALIFSPHPDDECIVGGLPLRLLRECATQIVNVAVTLGSNRLRRRARWRELRDACEHLGFDTLTSVPGGLEQITAAARAERPGHWAKAVTVIADILATARPEMIFFPHAGDWNRTHVGTHWLLRDALSQVRGLRCLVVETEYWSAMTDPNLLVESSIDDVTDLVTALALHRGEVVRNPYHLRLPAWMIDNVRRGAELVGGQGMAAPDFVFATLYRLSRWADGGLHTAGSAEVVGQHANLNEFINAQAQAGH